MRYRTEQEILPDQDSISLQDFYLECVSLVENFNDRHEAQVMELDFHLLGGFYEGEKRDYKGSYVNRDRSVEL